MWTRDKRLGDTIRNGDIGARGDTEEPAIVGTRENEGRLKKKGHHALHHLPQWGYPVEAS